MKTRISLAVAMIGAGVLADISPAGQNGIVSFKDAGKIKSWDAWNDKGAMPTNWVFKEKKCVTWEKIRQMKSGLENAGWLETRKASDIKSTMWSVGCETMDRDYADWNEYKMLLPDLGCTRGRLFSGWAKTEQEKGVYDFTWLDPQVREMAAMGIKPWICISYGNPVWGSDFRLGMKVRQVTDNAESFAAWLRYVRALVTRYKDVVNEWEIWNEPFGQREEYALMVYETAKAIKEVQPEAVCLVTAISWNGGKPGACDYITVLEKLKKENALDLVKWWIYHPYSPRPEDYYKMAMALRKLVKSYNPDFDIMQGETGCPSQLEYAHAMHSIEWTEYSQAKWNLRRAIGDRARDIPSSCFTFIDLQYTFMLQSFGLVRASALKQPVYRRPSYYAMRNVYSYFDEDVHALGVETRTVNGREMTVAKFERYSTPVWCVWYSDKRPDDSLVYERADLSALYKWKKGFVWVDLMRGEIGKLEDLTSVPVWDSPVMIARNEQVPRATDWRKMKPAEIVDALYRPNHNPPGSNGLPRKMPLADEPWTKMETKDFLPCFDKYGQFKYREWPGKTHSDAELRAVAAEEEKDLAAHAGPADWNKYGGWSAGPQLKATGRFRTEKVDGKWWLVDPEGRLFWSWGAVRVTPSSAMTPLNGNPRTPKCGGPMPDRDCLFEALPKPGEPLARFYDTYDELLLRFYLARGETRRFDFSAANLYRKYGDNWFETYADLCHRRLRSWGANTIANSSDLRICLQDRTPYAERVEVKSRPIAASWGAWFKFRDPFDASFKEGCRAALEAHGREAHDPWCIGFFIDNEIQWGAKETDLAQWALWSPDDQPAKIAFVKRLAAKGINPAKDAVPEAELKAFTAVIVEEYFKRTREAVKEFDPGLLYLGCRFAGHAPAWAIGPCAKHCDVVSYNIYKDRIDTWRLPQNLDAPVMIGEFHFGAHDRGLFGASLINKGSQEGRAAALKGYVESALVNPQIVGVHWHQFSDQATSGRFDGEYFQVGWTDICDRPYKETVDALRSIELYPTRARGNDPYDYKKTVQRRVAPAAVTARADGGTLVDFGKEAFGFLEFVPPAGTRGAYEVRLGELLDASGAVNLKPGATIRAARVTGEIARDGVHRVPLTPDARNTAGGREGAAIPIPAEHGVILPFRYAEVVRAPFPVTKDTVRMVAVNYPMDMSASAFACSDFRLTKVYDLCKHSILATSFAGLYVDGDRERIPYEADAYLNQLSEYAVHADYSLGRASHEYLMRHPTWPTEWKQHSIKMAWADWMWSGDTRSLAKFYDELKNDKLLEKFRRADGLLLTGGERAGGALTNHVGLADIVDWPPHERDGFVFRDVNAVVNAFHHRNLQEMRDIARALGKTDDAAAFARRADAVRAAFNRVFFDPARGVYRDGEGTDHASQHANAAALAFGLVPEAAKKKVAAFCASRGMACSVYFAQYLLEALFEADAADAALALMTAAGDRSWLGMIEQGATVTMEAWAVKYKPNLDLNHAWGTPPLNVISRYVLGVTPAEAGFAKIAVRPRTGSLARVEGTVPTAKGPVKVRVADGALTVETPAPARVTWAGRTAEVAAGRHTFK